ncbi:MAG TPA: ATP-binding cassette domain-containing protein [Chitinophagales bacterium]|nr:ATP-binding cassette domain-containing protein [Chitinophagales bacterium]
MMGDEIAIFKDIHIIRGGCLLQPSFSFIWKKGQVWCVTGPTGSGKTTFLKIIAGIIFTPDSKISFPLLEILKAKSKEKVFISDWIAFVPQEIKIPTIYIEDLYYQRRFQAAEQDDIPTVWEVLIQAAQQNETTAKLAADWMNLDGLLYQPFVQLSNGQTRRLMIAIALAKQPKILILDNPYTGLDQDARDSLNAQLRTLVDKGINILMAAHEHEIASMDFVTNSLKFKNVHTVQQGNDLPECFKNPAIDLSKKTIQMSNIRVTYGSKTVLNIPEWTVLPKERWIIKGKNGSGKSTLLSLIMADHPQAYSNEIHLFGNKRGSGESIWEIKKRIGFFSPELLRFFDSSITAHDIIASGWNDIVGQTTALSQNEKQKVQELVGWLGINEIITLKLGDLSLGQQKMILIARAMIRNPELLILDEPLQGMDTEWREHFKGKIEEFSQSRTILYVTHDKEEIPSGHWETLEL